MRRKLYVWWLYHGPGFKNIRRSLRINDEILPIKGIVYDAHFTGKNAIAAENAVAELRGEIIDHATLRTMPQEGQVAKILEPRRLVVDKVQKTGDVGGLRPRKVESQHGKWEREQAKAKESRIRNESS